MRGKSVDIDPENTERSQGFLTQTTREYLLDEWEPSPHMTREDKRQEIKKRTRHAIADIALIERYGDHNLINEVVKRDQGKITVLEENTVKYAGTGLSRFMFDIIGWPRERREELLSLFQSPNADIELKETLEKGLVGSNIFPANQGDMGDPDPSEVAGLGLYLANQFDISYNEYFWEVWKLNKPSLQLHTRVYGGMDL